MSFSIEANEITLSKLHILRKYIKTYEIVEYTEKRCWISVYISSTQIFVDSLVFIHPCSRIVDVLKKSEAVPRREEGFLFGLLFTEFYGVLRESWCVSFRYFFLFLLLLALDHGHLRILFEYLEMSDLFTFNSTDPIDLKMATSTTHTVGMT